jgi:hypothetical protein
MTEDFDAAVRSILGQMIEAWEDQNDADKQPQPPTSTTHPRLPVHESPTANACGSKGERGRRQTNCPVRSIGSMTLRPQFIDVVVVAALEAVDVIQPSTSCETNQRRPHSR